MSQRAHMWIRLVALVVIAAISCLPRADRGSDRAGGASTVAEVAHK